MTGSPTDIQRLLSEDEQQLLQLVTYLGMNKHYSCNQLKEQWGGEEQDEGPARQVARV
jgi:hypothetical protein